MRIAVFGLGEAGSAIADDLAHVRSLEVHAYDPAPRATPEGVVRHRDPADAVARVDAVLAITAAADADRALRQALEQIPRTAIYADLSTASAATKRALAAVAEARQLRFVDVAMMAPVPGRGVHTPQLAAGAGAQRYVELLAAAGSAEVCVVGDQPGEAATRKLLRSVVIKGLTGVVIEAMRAAEVADLSAWLWHHIAGEIRAADEALLHRLVTGTSTHARRRLHEMEAAGALLADLGVEPLMTTGTVEQLRQVLDVGLPTLPDSP